MKFRGLSLILPALLLSTPLLAQSYKKGDIVQDYTLKDYETGALTSLYELGAAGGVLVLEWFAWWCPFCSHAAANVETGIINHYGSGGNANGIPVRHIALNVQGGARPQSDTFISTYGYQTIVEDYDRSFYNLFDNNSGQPLFVVINAEANSPTAGQWEVLDVWLTYGSFPDISASLRPIIDSMQAGIPPEPEDPVLDVFPNMSDPIEGWYSSDWFGNFHGSSFPWIFHEEFGYGYLLDGPDEALYLWSNLIGWTYTDPSVFPFLFSANAGGWLYPLIDEEGMWLYDYQAETWLHFP